MTIFSDDYLAGQLTKDFGKGFDESSLRRMRQFYKTFPIRATLWHELSWSHYRLIMRIEDDGRREFYGRECAESGWSGKSILFSMKDCWQRRKAEKIVLRMRFLTSNRLRLYP